MRVDGRWYRSIWLAADGWSIEIIDQTALPGRFEVVHLVSVDEVGRAISTMQVRGAPLIGVTAAYGVALAMRRDPSDAGLAAAIGFLGATRPTAVNLRWALERARVALAEVPPAARVETGYRLAAAMADEDVEACRRIGGFGESVLADRHRTLGGARPLRVLTHCNAGWLATVDWGTALAPIYHAHDAGMPIHVWVDETRPRNQGLLTAWELAQHGVPHTVIVDNAGGLLMKQGRVDLCIVGTDRVARNGDVANKIGTYLKALAAFDNEVPFYVAAPSSSVDWTVPNGAAIPIEERPDDELGLSPDVPVANPAFDVTPARLVAGLITERGIAPATADGLATLFPERGP
ncbi:MAG: S-methyl-5-thioribose-1-phosphate isomerase [Gemmatimonadales bacterium]